MSDNQQRKQPLLGELEIDELGPSMKIQPFLDKQQVIPGASELNETPEPKEQDKPFVVEQAIPGVPGLNLQLEQPSGSDESGDSGESDSDSDSDSKDTPFWVKAPCSKKTLLSTLFPDDWDIAIKKQEQLQNNNLIPVNN